MPCKQQEKNNITCPQQDEQLNSLKEPLMPENQHDIFKQKDYQQRILYCAKLSFKNQGTIKAFPGKENLKSFVATPPVYKKH